MNNQDEFPVKYTVGCQRCACTGPDGDSLEQARALAISQGWVHKEHPARTKYWCCPDHADYELDNGVPIDPDTEFVLRALVETSGIVASRLSILWHFRIPEEIKETLPWNIEKELVDFKQAIQDVWNHFVFSGQK